MPDEFLAEADFAVNSNMSVEAHIKYGIGGPSLNSKNLNNQNSYYQRDELNVMLTSAQNTEVREYPSVNGMDSDHRMGGADVTGISPYCMKVIGDLRKMKTQSTHKTSSRRRITGQGMTEYIIVLALVALAAVVAVGFFGDTVQSQFASMGQKLTGNSGAAAIAEGKTAADNAVKTITTQETLGTYAN